MEKFGKKPATYTPYTVNDSDSAELKKSKTQYNELIGKPSLTKKEEKTRDTLKNFLGTQKTVAQNTAVATPPMTSNRDVSFGGQDSQTNRLKIADQKRDEVKSQRVSKNPDVKQQQVNSKQKAEQSVQDTSKEVTKDLAKNPLKSATPKPVVAGGQNTNTTAPVSAEEIKTPEQQKKLNYNSLYSYFKSGGFGDPSGSDAKRDFGFAILNTIGDNMQNLGSSLAGNQGTAQNSWAKTLEAGKAQEQEFTGLDKKQSLTLEQMKQNLANNKDMQSYINNLQKDFQNWTIENGVKWANDKEKLNAYKDFVAASGNQLRQGGGMDLFKTGASTLVSILPFLMMSAVSDERCKEDKVNLSKAFSLMWGSKK